MNATEISVTTGAAVSALAALAATRQWYVHRGDETREAREEREATELRQREDRYDAGVWKIVGELQATQERQTTELREVRDEVGTLWRENSELRADLLRATATVRSLTSENERLTLRVAELERTTNGGH